MLQGEEALLRYSLAQHGATEADIQRAIALQRANTAQRDATEAAEDARREAEEKFKEQLKELETAADRMGSHVTDAFQAWVTGAAKAKDAFADMVTGVLREMARLALQRTVTQPLTDFFLGLIGGVLGGSTRGAGPVGTRVPDPVFGGPNAGSGGASMASRPSFSLGGARAGGGTGPVIVHQNVSFSIAALDGPSVADMLRAQKGTIAQVVGEAARESTGFRSLLARG